MKGYKISYETLGSRINDYCVIWTNTFEKAIKEFTAIDFDGIKYTESAITNIEVLVK